MLWCAWSQDFRCVSLIDCQETSAPRTVTAAGIDYRRPSLVADRSLKIDQARSIPANTMYSREPELCGAPSMLLLNGASGSQRQAASAAAQHA